jgi:hypothetical protein
MFCLGTLPQADALKVERDALTAIKVSCSHHLALFTVSMLHVFVLYNGMNRT